MINRSHVQVRRLRGNRLARTSGWLMASTVGTSLLGYSYWVLAARCANQTAVGSAAAELAIAGLIAQVAIAGLAPTLVQCAARCSEEGELQRAIAAALTIGAIVAGLAAMAVAVVAGWTGANPGTRNWALSSAFLLLASPLMAVNTLIDAALLARRYAGYVCLHNLACSALKLPLLLLATRGLLQPVPAILAATLLALIFSAAGAVRLLIALNLAVAGAKLRVVAGEWRQLYGTVPLQQLIGLGGSAWLSLLPVLVVQRLSAAANAYSAMAWMSGGMCFMISASIANALFADSVRVAHDLHAAVQRSAYLTATLLLPAIIGAMVAGGRLLAVFGPQYSRQAAPLLALLALAAIPDAVTNLATAALRVQQRLLAAAVLNLVMPVSSLALAWYWLPRYGIMAGGWSWIVGQCIGVVLVFGLLCSRR